ncbi:MAG TPA: triose-phosphate isomerase family protein [Flavobacteriaceae bacterium]|jgi:triosephosphate isomerase|nr:triose-phosphate isomerase [Flavobacteriaceae bacterium]HJO70293.1 triose-phosphate isomerase family protein [Flavobacteriaceae bacterium]|tara:strand:+ start:7387 stop:8061 length:675 start_codon:yes stop_codon:yes gene_type:complete
MKQKIVIGNWKNYLNESETIKLAKEILDEKLSDNIRLMISPCNLYLNQVNQIMKGSSVEVIGQNITSYESTSDTGGVTAIGLKDLGINRSIIGHSEVRKINKRSKSEDVLIEIIPTGFQFILCFENIEQIPFDILNNSSEMILAYEPVWAIGTGETASIEHINEIHRSVKSELSKLSLDIPVLYGGSVNPTNSKEILSQELVDGVLVGGASTKHEDLHKIINSI